MVLCFRWPFGLLWWWVGCQKQPGRLQTVEQQDANEGVAITVGQHDVDEGAAITPEQYLDLDHSEDPTIDNGSDAGSVSVGETEPMFAAAADVAVSENFFLALFDKYDKFLRCSDLAAPVKIAILDSGIDHSLEIFKKWYSFEEPEQSEQGWKRVYEDDGYGKRIEKMYDAVKGEVVQLIPDDQGHGTHVAAIVSSVAPRAKLFIAKVVEEKKVLPNREAIEKALRWAIDEKVDVINLSLGFKKQRDAGDKIQELLREAQKNHIVVFAAASNRGGQGLTWPASNKELAIAIHSCEENFTTNSSFTPYAGQDIANFMVVGENTLALWMEGEVRVSRPANGTSFATATATGIGALIIDYARTYVARESKKPGGKDNPMMKRWKKALKKLNTNRGMTRVLEWIHNDWLFENKTHKNGMYCVIPPDLFWPTPSIITGNTGKQPYIFEKIVDLLRGVEYYEEGV